MHVDVYFQLPAPQRHSGAPRRNRMPQDVCYTGDTFVITQPRDAPPQVRQPQQEGFWTWLSHLFG